MDELEIRHLIDRVARGALSRRDFVRFMVGAGLTAPMAAQILGAAGLAQAQTDLTPTRRGGGGPLRLLWWEAPRLLNPHLAVGAGDRDGSRIFYEPLAAYAADGTLVPVLAAEVPSVQNGAVAADGRSVTWKLKPGVRWHDGRPLTADDVVFTWEYAADPATAATTQASYRSIERVEKLDGHTVRVVFVRPTPFWSEPFCGERGLILPRHVFEGSRGTRAREAPANLKPVGTGAFRFVDFRPAGLLRGELNRAYHVPGRPFFDTIQMKAGGDPVLAAQAVLQSGEDDFAWNPEVEDDVLHRMEAGGRGRIDVVSSGDVELLQLNNADPWRQVGGERSSVKAPHPMLTDIAVRNALNLLVDRAAIQQVHGRLGQTTANVLVAPARYHSRTTRWEFNPDRANQILDASSWKRGPDGIRVSHGLRLKLVYRTPGGTLRHRTQAIVKQACARAGIEVELRSVPPALFFSSESSNPDALAHFTADLQGCPSIRTAPDPGSFMEQFASWEVASRANGWQGRNVTRWRNGDYDRLCRAQETELEPVRRTARLIRMNDLVVQNVVAIPILWRNAVSAVSLKLRGTDISGWDSSLWRLPYWYRDA